MPLKDGSNITQPLIYVDSQSSLNSAAALTPQQRKNAAIVGTQNYYNSINDDLRQEEIRLIARDQGVGQHGVRFYVTPELNETRTVNYQEISEMRQAGGILIYIGSQSRTYQLNARMVSRSPEEADRAFRYTHILKSWTVPNKDGVGVYNENAPEILKLYGYGYERQLRGVPVVITSLSIDYPSNVTYVKTSNEKAFIPVIQTFSIALKEARNTDELEAFSLAEYRQGKLINW